MSSYMDDVYYAMFTCQSGNTGSESHTIYWLASRCVNLGISYDAFGMCAVISGHVGGYFLYDSDNTTYSISFALRPAVEISLNSVKIGETGNGESSKVMLLRISY